MNIDYQVFDQESQSLIKELMRISASDYVCGNETVLTMSKFRDIIESTMVVSVKNIPRSGNPSFIFPVLWKSNFDTRVGRKYLNGKQEQVVFLTHHPVNIKENDLDKNYTEFQV